MSVLESITVRARGMAFPALACGEGPLVLCLHGFPDCLRSFREQLPALAAAGFRAVAPALRGYAPSCTPAALSECHALQVAQDAIAIVQALGAPRAHLVGHDWGAVAAYLAAAMAPQRWGSVSALAVPHPLALIRALPYVPRQLRRSWYILFFQLPGLPEAALRARDFELVARLWRDWSPGYVCPPSELAAVKATLRQPRVVPAALAYYRHLVSPRTRAARAALTRPLDVPVLALTGAQDGCIDTRLFGRTMDPRWLPQGALARITDAGHFLHQERPAEVNLRLIAWIERHQ